MKSIVEFLKKNDTFTKGITFVNNANEEYFMSYHEFIEKATKVLGFLQSKGIKENDEIVFQLEDTRSFLLFFWACVMGKIIPVPVLVGNNDEHKRKIIKIWEELKKPYIVVAEKNLEVLSEEFKRLEPDSKLTKEFSERNIIVEKALESEIEGNIIEANEDDLCFIQFSSGSTGAPKGVMLTHKNLITNTGDIIKFSGLREDDTILNWMPLTHDMGLIGCHLSVTRVGMSQVIMPTTLFARHPLLWLSLIDNKKITVSCSPNFGYKLILKYWERKKKREKNINYDLSSLRLLFNGAEPISYELEMEFLNEFSKYNLNKNCMMNVYGLAEASLAVSFPKPGEDIIVYNVERESLKVGKTAIFTEENINSVKLVDLGKTIGNLKLKIVDDAGKELPEKTTGYVLIKGDNVTKGYYQNEKATQNTISKDGWLKTGDVGFVISSRLVITGRAKDIIFVNGQNYYPPDIEKICENIDKIELNTVAASGVRLKSNERDYIAIFILFRGSIDEFVDIYIKVKRTLQRVLGIDVDYVVPVLKIPKTTSGKIQRFTLAKKLENGEYDEIIDEIEGKLKLKKQIMIEKVKEKKFKNITEERIFELCAEYVDMTDANVSDNFSNLGFTSMTLVRLMEDIKSEFDKKIMISDLFAYSTIEKLAEFIENENQLIIRKNIFKKEFINNNETEEVPLEFEMEISEKNKDIIIKKFLDKALENNKLAIIYKENNNFLECFQVSNEEKILIERFSLESLNRAKFSYYENGFSVLIVESYKTSGMEDYFDIIIEIIEARYGKIIVFSFYNEKLKAYSLCENI